MNIDELFRERIFTAKQQMALRTAQHEDEIGLERLVRETATAQNPAAALMARVQRGEHRARSRLTTVVRQRRVTTLAQAITYAAELYHARVAAYPPVDEPGWRADDHLGYAAERTAYVTPFLAGDIEHGLRQALAQTRLRIVS